MQNLAKLESLAQTYESFPGDSGVKTLLMVVLVMKNSTCPGPLSIFLAKKP